MESGREKFSIAGFSAMDSPFDAIFDDGDRRVLWIDSFAVNTLHGL